MAKLLTGDGTIVCANCEIADTAWSRLRGLLGRSRLEAGEGLLLRPSGSIHMFFMRFPIDAVFCDRQLTVLKVVPNLRPWRTAGARGAHVTIELAAGAAAGVAPGDRLVLEVVPPAEQVGERVP